MLHNNNYNFSTESGAHRTDPHNTLASSNNSEASVWMVARPCVGQDLLYRERTCLTAGSGTGTIRRNSSARSVWDNSSHDTFDCIVLHKEFVMPYPEFMECRRRRLGAAAPIGGRRSGRGMYYPHRQQPRLDSGASWSRGRPPPPPQRAGSGPGGA